MVKYSSILILLAGSLFATASPIPDPVAVGFADAAFGLSNGERMQRGLAVGSPKKLFDASKRDNAARAQQSPSPVTYKTFQCDHGQDPVCCFQGQAASDSSCFNAFAGTGGAATTAPFTCESANSRQPGATAGACYIIAQDKYTTATQL